MPRSASTWSFNVVRRLMAHLESGRGVHAGYNEDVGEFLASVPAGVTHAVVKCHGLHAAGRALARAGDAKVVFTWRDPADAVASCMRMYGCDFRTALDRVTPAMEVHRFHRQTGTALILEYDRIVHAGAEMVERVRRYLGLEDRPGVAHVVAEELSLDRMRERSRSLPEAAVLVARSGVPHDPTTLLHPGHVIDGSSGYGRRLLTARQLRELAAAARRIGGDALEGPGEV
jgi:hypothetical protein